MKDYIYLIIAVVFVLLIALIAWRSSIRQTQLMKDLIEKNITETNQELQTLKGQLNHELYVFQNEGA